MSKARHKRINIIPHNSQQHLQQFFNQSIQLINFVASVQFHVQGDLVIATASSMQLLAHITDTVSQVSLHKAVDILVLVSDI